MMEPVIYGPTPSITTERLSKAPPEKTFKSPKNWLPEKNASSRAGSIPGTGIAAKSRKAAKKAKRNKNFFRKSLSLKRVKILFHIFFYRFGNQYLFIKIKFFIRFSITQNFYFEF